MLINNHYFTLYEMSIKSVKLIIKSISCIHSAESINNSERRRSVSLLFLIIIYLMFILL